MERRRTRKASLGLTGIWLNPGQVETSIQNLTYRHFKADFPAPTGIVGREQQRAREQLP